MTRHPLPFRGSPRVEFPACSGTMGCSDLLRPSRRTRLPSPDATMRCVCRFAPVGPERRPRARGSCSGPHCRTWSHGDDPGSPRFLKNPCVPTPCSSTPAGPTRQALRRRQRGPRYVHDEGSHDILFFRGSIARPWHSLSTLRPVPCGTRRKTRFPLLATLRGGIGYPQDSSERFPSCFLHLFPLSQAFLAQGHTLNRTVCVRFKGCPLSCPTAG